MSNGTTIDPTSNIAQAFSSFEAQGADVINRLSFENLNAVVDQVAGQVDSAKGARAPIVDKMTAPSSKQDLQKMVSTLGGIGDAMAFMTLLQSEIRDAGSKTREADIESKEASLSKTHEQEKKAIETAKKKLEEAGGLFGFITKEWKKVVGVVLCVVGAVAGVFTGGVSGALCVIGASLLLTAEVLTTMAEEGILLKDNPVTRYVIIGVKIAGALCSLGGAAAGAFGAVNAIAAIPQAAKTAVQITSTVAQCVQGTIMALEAGDNMRSQILTYEGIEAQGQAEAAQSKGKLIQGKIEDAADDLLKLQKRFRKVMEKIQQIMDAQSKARSAAFRAA